MEAGGEQHVYSFDVEKASQTLTVCQGTQRLMLPLSLGGGGGGGVSMRSGERFSVG